MAAHQAPPSLGFSRQEHWSGLPFPSPTHESEKWKWSCSVVSDPQRLHRLQPSRLLRPWHFPGKSTGVGCHCLLRCQWRKGQKKKGRKQWQFKRAISNIKFFILPVLTASAIDIITVINIISVITTIIRSEEHTTEMNRYSCTQMLTAVLFTH